RRRTLLAGPAALARLAVKQQRPWAPFSFVFSRLDTLRDNGTEGSSKAVCRKGDAGVWCDIVFSDLTMHVVNKESRQH
ncbi:unnamed protein product, partial [Ixodes hexagonus]